MASCFHFDSNDRVGAEGKADTSCDLPRWEASERYFAHRRNGSTTFDSRHHRARQPRRKAEVMRDDVPRPTVIRENNDKNSALRRRVRLDRTVDCLLLRRTPQDT